MRRLRGWVNGAREGYMLVYLRVISEKVYMQSLSAGIGGVYLFSGAIHREKQLSGNKGEA